ncbi:MAG: pilin [Burkholderiales bacterium]|nr:pilin [Burkholderiales bacterium]
MTRHPRRQSGFTLIELIIAMCIAAILGSIAMNQMRDYTRRARMSEVVMATSQCKGKVTEGYLVRDSAPPAGGWDCEGGGGATEYAGNAQTTADGWIRIPVTNLDSQVNGHYVYMVPAKMGGNVAMNTTNDLGDNVQGWICGSDWAPVLNALPANCRTDMTTYASDTYGP